MQRALSRRYSSDIGKHISSLRTPAFLVDRKVVHNNAKQMRERANTMNVDLRPHVKTHKTIQGALIQTEGLKSPKIVVSTMAEAQFFADSGHFSDILYAVPISEEKLYQTWELSQKINFHIEIDCEAHLQMIRRFALRNKRAKFSVFLKLDTGYHRCGADPEDRNTLNFARRLSQPVGDNKESQITLAGIYSHAGHSYKAHTKQQRQDIANNDAKLLTDFYNKLQEHGVSCPTVSVGSTPSCSVIPSQSAVTEIHPGNYLFYDRMQAEIGSCNISDCAVSVLGTVIGAYPSRNTIAVDIGSLALSKDVCEEDGFGLVVGHPKLKLFSLSQEIGLIKGETNGDLQVGSLVRVSPNHSCLAAACFPKYHVIENDHVVDEWVPCRGW